MSHLSRRLLGENPFHPEQCVITVCVLQGKPRPVATWFKDGQPVDPKMINVRNSNVDTILFIRSAEREHSGKYELLLQIENMEDRATIEIRVVGKGCLFEEKH